MKSVIGREGGCHSTASFARHRDGTSETATRNIPILEFAPIIESACSLRSCRNGSLAQQRAGKRPACAHAQQTRKPAPAAWTWEDENLSAARSPHEMKIRA